MPVTTHARPACVRARTQVKRGRRPTSRWARVDTAPLDLKVQGMRRPVVVMFTDVFTRLPLGFQICEQGVHGDLEYVATDRRSQ